MDDITKVLEKIKSSMVVGENADEWKSGESRLCRADCPICGGFGWFREDVPVGHPKFGTLIRCPNVDVASLPGAVKYGISPEEWRGLDWNTILPLDDSRAVEAAEIVRAVLSRGWGWVYLWGDHGQAKTLILRIAVAASLRANIAAGYANMADILSFMRASFDAERPNIEIEDRLEFWAGLPVLAIDEIDRINSTSWARETRFRLFDSRYVSSLRRESVTLIASNQPPESLDSYVRDRILDGRHFVVELRGQSARLGMSESDWF